MKLKNIIASVLLTLGVGVAGISAAQIIKTKEVRVADAANTDNSKEKWSAIGTISGSSWNKDFPLAYDATDDRYELEIALTAGNEFKIRLNNAWTTSIGYGGNTGAGISTYLSNSGGNFKVKTTGNYILWVKDDKVANYGDKSYGFGIDKAAEAVYYTVKHYNEDGTVGKEETVLKDSTYNPHFIEKEGFRLEGWYKDKNLTTKMEKSAPVTSDLTLYPKYEKADDYTILIPKYFFGLADEINNKMYVFLWRDSTDAGNNGDFPGTAIDTTSPIGTEWLHYPLLIDASKSYTKLIISVGTGTSASNSQHQSSDTILDYDNLKTYEPTGHNKEVNVGYSIYSLTYDIKIRAGGWENKVSTNNCYANYKAAKELFSELNESTKTAFEEKTTDNDVVKARETYTHWCRINNDTEPFNGNKPQLSNRVLGTLSNSNVHYIIIGSILLLLTAAGYLAYIRYKKEKETYK